MTSSSSPSSTSTGSALSSSTSSASSTHSASSSIISPSIPTASTTTDKVMINQQQQRFASFKVPSSSADSGSDPFAGIQSQTIPVPPMKRHGSDESTFSYLSNSLAATSILTTATSTSNVTDSNPHLTNDDIDSLLFPQTTSRNRSSSPPASPTHMVPNIGTAPSFKLSIPVSPNAHTIAERIAMISACINSGDVNRAVVLFNRSNHLHPEEMRNAVSEGMFNAFIEAFLTTATKRSDGGRFSTLASKNGTRRTASTTSSAPSFTKALEWHRRMTNEFGVKPSEDGYAMLIRHALLQNDLTTAARLVWEMEGHGISTSELISSVRFSEREDRVTLEALLRSMAKLPHDNIDGDSLVDGSSIAERILESASATTISDGKSGDSDSSIVNVDKLMLTAMKESADAEAKSETMDTSTTTEDTRVKTPLEQLAEENLRVTDSAGVKILRKTLATLRKDSGLSKLDQQRLLEEKALQAAVEEKEVARENLPSELKKMVQLPSSLVAQWMRVLIPLIKKEMDAMEDATTDADDQAVLPFLKLLSPEQMARITVSEFLKIPERKDVSDFNQVGVVPTATVMGNIGHAIEQEYNLQQISKKKNQKMLKTELGIHSLHMNGRLGNTAVRMVMSRLAREEEAKMANLGWRPKWPAVTHMRAGSVLASLLFKSARVMVPVPDPKNPHRDIFREEPAFDHELVANRIQNKMVGVIRYNPYLLERLANDPVHVHPRLLPMVVKPRPWLTRHSGGYLHYKSEVVRTSKNLEHVAYITAADERQLLGLIYEGLDVLGATAWRINEKVYDVVRKVWNSGEAVADVPPAEMPSAPKKPANWESMGTSERKGFLQMRKKMEADKRNAFSQRCDMNYKIEIARAFLGETIYFPHNLDFRGRAYPIPAHLNHMGNDFCRGLLLFNKGKPLGETGLKWLKIQVANLAGYDKASFTDREKWTETNMDNVIDSVENPLDGKRWWLKAENPWQLLATCFELVEAIRSPDPTQFLSRIPIHQDGTCNGLQHYAALGGDKLGAAQVNLIKTDKPADIYTAVSEQVRLRVEADAEKGCEISKKLVGKINRKLVKQTVMTNTYGVTFVGARRQVMSRMREQPELYKFSDEEIKVCSLHVTKLIFGSLGELFKGASAIQHWLNKTARMVAKSIPMDEIPEIQLRDAEVLNRMGCLPSCFSIVGKESGFGKVESESLSASKYLSETGSGGDMDSFDALLDAALDDLGGNDGGDSLSWMDGDVNGDDVVASSASTTANGKQAAEIVDDTELGKGGATFKVGKDGHASFKPSRMSSVIWTTPLGLPIVQPYRELRTKEVKTLLQTVTVVDHHSPSPVNPQKQSTAFPPNFIHSLDATHMMLSAIACNRAGLDFASVHDSYWTHASDVETMSAILREAFVKLHSMDVMKKLREEMIERYRGYKFPVVAEIHGEENLQAWRKRLLETGRESSAKMMSLRKSRKVATWVDLEFPELPPRGDFDIKE
ncbi:DNA-directed RNA polymerase, partial [Blyttiomyces sp. JEL0837]